MKRTLMLSLAGSVLAVVALAGCSSSAPAAKDNTSPSSSPSAAAKADAAVATSGLGKIVVDGKGMTAYVFDKDTVGATTSSCTGQCATLWPAIVSTSAKPKVDGVTGTVATIDTATGTHQVTVNGLPIYTYAKDTKAGDTAGQAVGGVWWVLSPAGDKISTTAQKSGY